MSAFRNLWSTDDFGFVLSNELILCACCNGTCCCTGTGCSIVESACEIFDNSSDAISESIAFLYL